MRPGRTQRTDFPLFRVSFAERRAADPSSVREHPVVRSCSLFRSIAGSCDDGHAARLRRRDRNSDGQGGFPVSTAAAPPPCSHEKPCRRQPGVLCVVNSRNPLWTGSKGSAAGEASHLFCGKRLGAHQEGLVANRSESRQAASFEASVARVTRGSCRTPSSDTLARSHNYKLEIDNLRQLRSGVPQAHSRTMTKGSVGASLGRAQRRRTSWRR